MKKLYFIGLICLLSTFLIAQDFTPKKILIDSLDILLASNGLPNAEEIIHCKTLNGEVHFVSHKNEILGIDDYSGFPIWSKGINLYKYTNGTISDPVNIGDLQGFIVDVLDHNGDGLTDILGHFKILLAESPTSFADASDPVELPMPASRYHRAQDFNGDGIKDILVLEPVVDIVGFKENVHIFLLNSNQEIEETITFNNKEAVEAVNVFDLNQDGLMDVAYTNDESELEIKMANSNGNWSIQMVDIENTGNFILGEDFDNDGDLDIIVTGANSKNIQLIWNNGSFGNYSKVIDTETIYSLHSADLDDDGNMDLCYLEEANGSLKVMVAMGVGDGNFKSPLELGSVKFTGANFMSPTGSINTYQQALESWLTVYDYDLDGDDDLLVNAIIDRQYVVFDNKLISPILDEDNDGFFSDEDCDDNNANINPGQTEVPYNGIDDDCDDTTLDDDLDQDGFDMTDDCDDNNANINPGETEVPYNGIDDDCNSATLDDDLDQDGFANADDCDDNNANINPGQTEIPYNGIDDDCDTATLDDDLDQDGFSMADDCDDNNANINPGQTEIPYNGINDDCDTATLDDDLDQDGFAMADDCDDNNANINPGQTEIPYNGIDDDCDIATLDDDLDQDGFAMADDCDDNNANINPGETEIPYNGIDDDCDTATLDDDLDQDGFANADDCDDSNASINPGQAEIPYNGIDDDCDAASLDDDLDQDGFIRADDCDDTNAGINPDAEEIPGNGIDEDCDGMDTPSSIHELSNTTINIYPNPVIDVINIVIENHLNFRASLYDLNGKLISTSINESTINVSSFIQGTYLLEIKDLDTDQKVVEKIIVGK